jgi:hypothetical protein
MLLMALIVVASSIFIFFLEEFRALFGRFMAIPGAKLLFPLLLASLLVEMYEDFGRWIVIQFKILLHQFLYQIAAWLPFETGAMILCQIIFLFLWASIPAWFFHAYAKRRLYKGPQSYQLIIGLTLWIFAAILLTIAL